MSSLLLASACLWLGGCDMLGIESSEKVAAARDADGRAIGGACRHAARAIEDCYALNKKADKAAIFAGWRDMNDYMRENKIDAVAPQMAAKGAKARGDDDAAPAENHDTKTADAAPDGGRPAKAEGEHPAGDEHAAAGEHPGAGERAAAGEHVAPKSVAEAKPEKEHRAE